MPNNDAVPVKSAIAEITAQLTAFAGESALHDEKNFARRIDAIDFIDFHIIDRIESLIDIEGQASELRLLKQRAENIKVKLDETNRRLFEKLREEISAEHHKSAAFADMVKGYVDRKIEPAEPDYDNLDLFINALLHVEDLPEPVVELDAEMVFYQKTPARVIFELVEKIGLNESDVFFDLGSGLGQAVILVNLLSGIKAIGVEIDPAFCDYSEKCASLLNLPGIMFINADVRHVNYSEGSVFFMYTPFRGQMLLEVLEILRLESRKRKIRVVTYGPCTAQVILQNWLVCDAGCNGSIYKLHVFNNF